MEQIILVPLTRREFRQAQSGHVIEKRCKIEGRDSCIMVSNHFIAHEEITNYLEHGFNVFPLDVSELSWWDINRKMKFNIVAEYQDGILLCIISQNMYHTIQKEREEGD